MKKILFVLFFLAFCRSAGAFDEKHAKALFESRCSLCHSEQWALELRKTKAGWKDTVERMKKKTAGNIISREDQKVIVEYLYRTRGK